MAIFYDDIILGELLGQGQTVLTGLTGPTCQTCQTCRTGKTGPAASLTNFIKISRRLDIRPAMAETF